VTSLLLWLLAGIPVALAVHEGAHTLCALALGGSDVRLRMRGARFEVTATLSTWRRVLAFTLAGGVANVVAGVGLVTIDHAGARALGMIQLLVAFSSFVPTGTSDGARALALWRREG
jgi:hypothetical protein